ncbi:chromate transporter [Cetobacterium somerae]|uniref:chromate transporter n=1 Tax=Cetobacterium sp. NK01 TaxID=2993530 RepID=UPI0021164292|nr:chromate transporter [Cetobacterium sp. NK01]MCQ8211055.1 chromate transporter [Cetobacterium sp. NK01]
MLDLFKIFFKLGCTAFGGPVAHISMVEREVVEKRKIISKEDFLDFIGSVNLIPGPNSTQIVMLTGLRYKGFWGMIVAGLSFIFPAAFITLLLAVIYSYSKDIIYIKPIFDYVKFGVFPIIIFSLINMYNKIKKNNDQVIVLLLSCFLNFFLEKEIFIIFSMGILATVYTLYLNKNRLNVVILPLWAIIFEKFFKIGATLFGGGYMLIAYISDLFVQSGILTETQLLDAIAFGQFTPGPILTTATFIGYEIGGVVGSIWATIGIFLPSFIFIYFLGSIVSKVRNNLIASKFLNFVNASSLGVMVSVILLMGKDLMKDLKGVPLVIINLLLIKFKMDSYCLIIISLIYGYLIWRI